MTRSILLLALGLSVTTPLAAQFRDPDIGRTSLRGGVHYVTSTGPTLHVALFRVTDVTPHDEFGNFVDVEGGLWGGKVGVGRGGVGPYGSGLLRLSYLRSWSDDGPVAQGQGFLGADLRGGIRMFSFGVGWHKRISGEASGDGSVFSFSAGLGF